MELNNIIFSFALLFVGYFFKKYSLLILKKNKFKLLSDNQFKKPQAFHETATYRLGGITIFSLLTLVFLFLFFFKNIFFLEYVSFCTLFFLLGLADDFKIDIRPKFRLLAMIAVLLVLVAINDLYIEKSGLSFLNNLLAIDIFALFFVSLCFLFIINGSNLIDGFNGLLGIHAIIIFMVLFFINFFGENYNLTRVLFYIILLLIIFLKFNFPKAKMFLGDSGAYLIGVLIAISAIKTSIANPSISPFFFCVLLFYLFFEVFFSFFRKIFVENKTPLFPDSKHLHMFLYKFLLKKYKTKLESNYMVSVYINLVYFLSLIPAIFFLEDGVFCRFYFFVMIVIYIYIYATLQKDVRKK